MKKIIILGEIGSGKSFIARLFGYPVFNADLEVSKIYKFDRYFFKKLKKKFPNFFKKFPIKKKEIILMLLKNKWNLKKLSKTIHPLVRKKMNLFLKKNKLKKIVVLDIPLYLENKLEKKNDIFVFVDAKKNTISTRLKKRKNFNHKIYNFLKKIQKSAEFKKKKSTYIIKNDFKKNSAKREVKNILKKIL